MAGLRASPASTATGSRISTSTPTAGRSVGHASQTVRLERPKGFQLWTFQANKRARHFYESRGCEAVEFTDGQRNEERVPDVRYVYTGRHRIRRLVKKASGAIARLRDVLGCSELRELGDHRFHRRVHDLLARFDARL